MRIVKIYSKKSIVVTLTKKKEKEKKEEEIYNWIRRFNVKRNMGLSSKNLYNKSSLICHEAIFRLCVCVFVCSKLS